MSRMKAVAPDLSRRSLALLALGVVLLFAQPRGQAQATDESLPFATSYSITGNYVVGGVDLLPQASVNGFVTGTIQMSGVPANADILAAFLYWETISTGPAPGAGAIGAKFRGRSIPVVNALSKSSSDLGSSFAPCWSAGGSGGVYNLTMYRADVLQLLPPQLDANGNSTGKRLVNGDHTVTLPEAGTGNQVPQSAGASLFVVYRDPNPAAPLTKVVLYDGLFVQTQGVAMTHTIRGFLDASESPVAKMTHIVGSGAPNAYDRVSLGGSPVPGGTDSFSRTSGGTSDRGWSNPTFNFTSLPGLQTDFVYGDSVTTTVDHDGHDSPNDCLSWAAIVFSTTVQDTDGDGLPDRLEDSTSGLKEPNGEDLPNINAMGASSTHRDIFIEIGAMQAAAGTTYGSLEAPFSSTLTSVSAPAHNHLPMPAVWKMVGDAFANAPVDDRYPSAGSGIKLHVDAGPDYVSGEASDYIVTVGARGGESILEAACVEPCQFPAYPGTVAWKTGFQLYRDALFDHARKDIFRYALYAHAKGTHKSPFPCLDSDNKTTAPASNGACTAVSGDHINPDFHVPKGISGSGDFPGGDFIVTLGLWDNVNFVGSDFVQASTTMHELGHTLDLGHGGAPPQFSGGTVSSQPNCKPNYLSVMNYLFQLGGLVDVDGVPHLGFSGVAIDPINETNLIDGSPTLYGPYRTSWYAPRLEGMAPAAKRFCTGQRFPDPPPVSMVRIDGSVSSAIDWNADGVTNAGSSQDVNFDGTLNGSPAAPPTPTLQGHDDWAHLRLNQIGSRRNIAGFSLGSQLLADGSHLLADGSMFLADGSHLLADGSMFLADGSQLLADGSVLLADGSQLLADGSKLLADGSQLLADGSVLLADGSVFLADGSQLLADGSVLLADGSVLLADGSQFLADGAVLLADGSHLLADGSVLLADGSQLLADGSTLNSNIDELTPSVAADSGNTPGPNELKACVIGVGACTPPPLVPLPAITLHRTRLDWKAPNVGGVSQYRVYRYRVVGGTITIGSEVLAGEADGSQTSLVDNEELPNGISFTYFVVADLVGGTVSGRSNYKTITAVNDPPVAGTDLEADSSYFTNQNTALVVPHASLPGVLGVLGNDTAGADSTSLAAVAFTRLLPSGGTVTLVADGSFTYTPATGFAGTDTFTYQANNGPWGDPSVPLSDDSSEVTVTIDVRDATPPLVTLTIPVPTGLAGYFVTSPVTVEVSATDPSNVIAFTCTDGVSPITVGSLSGIETPAASGHLSVSGEGTHNLSCTATDGRSNSGAASGSSNTGAVKIDTVAPTVTITTPANNASYLLHQSSIASSYGCSDIGGSGVATCTGPVPTGSSLNTSTLGSTDFTVSATDVAGNSASVTHTYWVVYNFVLTPPKSPSNLGNAVPLTWQLRDFNGVRISDLTSLVKLTSHFTPGVQPVNGVCPITYPGSAQVHLYSPATGATGGSDFRVISGPSFRFNWDTKSALPTGPGCYTLVWQLKGNSGPAPDYAVLNPNLLKKASIQLK